MKETKLVKFILDERESDTFEIIDEILEATDDGWNGNTSLYFKADSADEFIIWVSNQPITDEKIEAQNEAAEEE